MLGCTGVACLLCWGMGPWERLEVRGARKNSKQTLCRKGSDLGRKGVGPFLVAAQGKPTFTCSSHPSWHPAKLWVGLYALAQPVFPFPAFCPGPISQLSVDQLLWHKEAGISVGIGLRGPKHPWPGVLSHRPLSTT